MREQGGRAQKKQENVRQLLSDDYDNILSSKPVLPLHYDDVLGRLLPTTAKVFQSAMTPIALEFIVSGTMIAPKYGTRRSSISIPWTSKNSDSGSTSVGKDDDMLCRTCSKTFGSCECKKCHCNANIAHMSGNKRHHCRRCCSAICENCGIETESGWNCKNIDICDRFAHRILRVMVKNGDDVRQDQMVIQIIRLMDKLLSDVSLDLCLSPYDVVAMK